MLQDKRIAYGALILGLAGVVFAIVIDPLRGYDVCLGGEQIAILFAGIAVALVGAYLAFVHKPSLPAE